MNVIVRTLYGIHISIRVRREMTLHWFDSRRRLFLANRFVRHVFNWTAKMRIHQRCFMKVAGVNKELSDINIWFNFIKKKKSFPVRHTERSEDMLRVELRTMPSLECNKTISDNNQYRNSPSLKHGVSKSQYCANDSHNMVQRCQILSGGALQIFPSDSILPRIVGVISFEFSLVGLSGGCNAKFPGIFARIANYVPWIESHVWPFYRSKYFHSLCMFLKGQITSK